MTTTTSTTAGFVQFLESTEDPGNLFAPDILQPCPNPDPGRWHAAHHPVAHARAS